MTEFAPRLMDHILPPNATNFERTLASQVDHFLSLDIPIEDLWNPWKCPEEFLPYLAWSLSVDLWRSEWHLTKKRSVVAKAIELARLKGTEAGLGKAIEIMDGKLKSVIAPPATLFLSVTRTEEERQNWLSRMPQLRIYPQRVHGPSSGFHIGQTLSGAFTVQSDAWYRATPRVTLFRDGAEKDILTLERRQEDPTISDAEEMIQARIPAPVPGMTMNSFGNWFPRASRAKNQVYTVRTRKQLEIPGSNRLAAEFSMPSYEPVDVRPDSIRAKAPLFGVHSGAKCFLGYGTSGYLIKSQARLQVYKRTYLHDPEVSTLSHTGRTFLGYNFRFGQADYTAELKIEIRQPRPPAAYSPLVYGFWSKPDLSAFDKVKEAVTTHQALRDRILINSRTHDVATAGQHLTAGQGLFAGQIVEI